MIKPPPTDTPSARLEASSRAEAQRRRAHDLIPGGAHTYAKGDDQYPEGAPAFIVRGRGCHVWDLDGREFIEYGMGLRSVTLGHAPSGRRRGGRGGHAAGHQLHAAQPPRGRLRRAAPRARPRRGHGQVLQERLGRHDGRPQARAGVDRARPRRRSAAINPSSRPTTGSSDRRRCPPGSRRACGTRRSASATTTSKASTPCSPGIPDRSPAWSSSPRRHRSRRPASSRAFATAAAPRAPCSSSTR